MLIIADSVQILDRRLRHLTKFLL